MFPTRHEKINAMFTTCMGLLDDKRVDANLHFHNNAVLKGKKGEKNNGEFQGMSKSNDRAKAEEEKGKGKRGAAARRRSLTTAF